MALGPTRQFQAVGLERKSWSDSGPIRSIFKAAFIAAGLPYFNPHSFRNTLALFGLTLCRTHEELKAWSQNFAHEKMLTTIMSYGTIDPRRQSEIIHSLARSEPATDAGTDTDKLLLELVQRMRKQGLLGAQGDIP